MKWGFNDIMISLMYKSHLDIRVEIYYKIKILMDIFNFKKILNFFKIKIKEFYMINLVLNRMQLSFKIMSFRKFIKTS